MIVVATLLMGAGPSALAHGTVTSQMKVAVQKVTELFDRDHASEADQVTQITTEKTGEERFKVLVKLPLKTRTYECGLDLPTPKKWGCTESQ